MESDLEDLMYYPPSEAEMDRLRHQPDKTHQQLLAEAALVVSEQMPVHIPPDGSDEE